MKGFPPFDLCRVVYMRCDDVRHGNLVELALGQAYVLKEHVEACGTLAVMIQNHLPSLLRREPPVTKVEASQVGGAPEAALDKFEIIPHALHCAFNLLVAIFRRDAFHLVLLPSNLLLDQLDLLLHVPRDKTAKAD